MTVAIPDWIMRPIRTVLQVLGALAVLILLALTVAGDLFGVDAGQLAAIGAVVTTAAGVISGVQNYIEHRREILLGTIRITWPDDGGDPDVTITTPARTRGVGGYPSGSTPVERLTPPPPGPGAGGVRPDRR